jgi:phosphocarrier protein HPr
VRVLVPGASASDRMTSKRVKVVNQLGMHARAAAKFVHLASRFQSRVQVAREARQMDGKSIMGILLLAAACGSTLTITAEGDDENAAVEALVALVHSGFGEDAACGA